MLRCRMGAEDEMRLPDEISDPTAATQLHDDYTLTPNAQGDIVIVENAGLTRYITSITAPGVVTLASQTATTKQTQFVAEARVARLVCVKIVITYVGAVMASAGYVSLTRKADAADVNNQNISALHNGCEKQFRAQEGCTFFLTYRQPPRFEDPGGATFMSATYPVFVIAGSGLPVSACLKVRMIRFMEYVPKEGTISENSTAVEPYNPGALQVHGQLSTAALSSYTSSERASYMDMVSKAANAAYHIAQPFLTNYIVPKATAYLKGALEAAPEAMGLMLTM